MKLLKKWHQPAETEVATAFLALTQSRAGDQRESDLLEDVEMLADLGLLEGGETSSDVHALTEAQHESLEQTLHEFPKTPQ